MIDRVAIILELAARSRHGITLTEFARELAAPVSSIQGLVNGLAATGYLDERDRRYLLGPAPFLLTRLAGRLPVTTVSHGDLAAMHEETGMTAVLAIVVGSDLYYVDYASSDARYAYLAEGFVRRSLIRTSAGWVLLAGMERRDLWAQISALPPEDTDLVGRFLGQLPQIQRDGLAVAPGVSAEADGVSVAVTEGGETVAAVGIMGDPREVDRRKEELIAVLARHRAAWARRAVTGSGGAAGNG
jgi:DNA-binding IclR family transcriptional regulator